MCEKEGEVIRDSTAAACLPYPHLGQGLHVAACPLGPCTAFWCRPSWLLRPILPFPEKVILEMVSVAPGNDDLA